VRYHLVPAYQRAKGKTSQCECHTPKKIWRR
jgi:hypothetical protein